MPQRHEACHRSSVKTTILVINTLNVRLVPLLCAKIAIKKEKDLCQWLPLHLGAEPRLSERGCFYSYVLIRSVLKYLNLDSQNVFSPVHPAYNPYFSSCFFSRNSVFLSRQISQQCFSAGLSAFVDSGGCYSMGSTCPGSAPVYTGNQSFPTKSLLRWNMPLLKNKTLLQNSTSILWYARN
jgi:hypothetical protein